MRKYPREGLPVDPMSIALHELIEQTKPTGVIVEEVRPTYVHLRLDIQPNCAVHGDGRPLKYFVQLDNGDNLTAVDPEFDREDVFSCTIADPQVLEKLWGFVMTPWPQPLFKFMYEQ